MERGVLPPRTFVTLQFERYQNNMQDVAGASSDISSWAAGAVTATWREPTNRDWIDQTSILVIFFASSDGRLRPHVSDVPPDKYIYAIRCPDRKKLSETRGWLCYCQQMSRKRGIHMKPHEAMVVTGSVRFPGR